MNKENQLDDPRLLRAAVKGLRQPKSMQLNFDGHYMDDPLDAVNAKPDFSDMGIPSSMLICDNIPTQKECEENIKQIALAKYPVHIKLNKKGTGEYDANKPRRDAYIQGMNDALALSLQNYSRNDLHEKTKYKSKLTDQELEEMNLETAQKTLSINDKLQWIRVHNKTANCYHMSNGEILEVPAAGWWY